MLLVVNGVGFAHDFWVVPTAFHVITGDNVELRAQTGTVFPQSVAAVASERVAQARILAASGDERLTDFSASGKSLLIKHRPRAAGQRVVALALVPRVTPQSGPGFERYLRLEGADAVADRYQREGRLPRDSIRMRVTKMAKTLVATRSDVDWDVYFATLVFGVGVSRGSSGASSRPPVGSSDSAAVAEVVTTFHRALATGDSARALSQLDPNVIILESGGEEGLAEYRSHHLGADIEYAKAVRTRSEPIRVTVRGDAAWASSTSTTTGTFRGRDQNSAGAELMVLVRTPSGWRIAAIHWSSRTRRSP